MISKEIRKRQERMLLGIMMWYWKKWSLKLRRLVRKSLNELTKIIT